MLIIERLTVSYGRKNVLENLTVAFGEAQIHGLVGLNGSGKTTLLNTIYGFKRPDVGSILFRGAKPNRSEISYLETENYFYSNITGKEYLSLFKSPDKDYRPDAWNQLFELPLDLLIDGYSTGMKKKLALMVTLKQGKTIVILDEPFNGLDMEASKVLGMMLARLRENGHTVIITSHILESLTSVCDCIHYLNDRKIQFTKGQNDFGNIGKEVFRNLETRYSEIIDQVM